MKVNNILVRQRFGVGGTKDNYSIGAPTPEIHDNECFIGVESEAEGLNMCYISDKVLLKKVHLTEDNSLKHMGVEMRFNRPLSGKDILKGLHEIQQCYDVSNSLYLDGARGSTHIHVDATELTMEHLINFVGISYILEPYLFSQCPPSRESTVFCVPINRTRDISSIMNAFFTDEINFNTDFHKYRAIGLSSLYVRGTIEFRMFDTQTNMSKILSWINTLQRARELATTVHFDFFKKCTQMDIEGFLYEIVGSPFPISPRVRKLMWDNIRQLSYVFNQRDPQLELGQVPEPTKMVYGNIDTTTGTWQIDTTPPTNGTGWVTITAEPTLAQIQDAIDEELT